MGKYYVQSGNLRKVVQSESARRAALWAVHDVLNQVLPLDGSSGESIDHVSAAANVEGPVILARRVTVSERGFDSAEATSMSTLDIVTEWSDLLTTLQRLERMLHRSG